jgi:hypothetical protein
MVSLSNKSPSIHVISECSISLLAEYARFTFLHRFRCSLLGAGNKIPKGGCFSPNANTGSFSSSINLSAAFPIILSHHIALI